MRKLSALTFAVMLFGQFAITWADPPAGRGAGIGAQSTVQRALDSRAGLQQRANPRTQGTATGGAGSGGGIGVGGVGVGQNSVNTNGNLGVSANVQVDANNAANAQSGTGRLPREVVVRRLQSLRSQQSAVVRHASRTDLGIGLGNNSPSDSSTASDSPAPSGKNPLSTNQPPRGKSGQGSTANAPADDNSDSSDRPGLLSLNGSARSEIVAHGQNRLALTNSDKLLAQRLARIDQMRDRAIESGNDQLLDRADRLELDARTQYADRQAGRANDASQTGADAQGQATGTIRGGINQASASNANPETPADDNNDSNSDTNGGLLSGNATAATRNNAAASARNQAQRTPNVRRPSTPSAQPMPDRNTNDQDTDGVSSQANAAAQNSTAASLNGQARRAKDQTRRTPNTSEPARKVRNASASGQANSATAADAASSNTTGNNSLNATGTSATNSAANAAAK